jgi:hypothetical protein
MITIVKHDVEAPVQETSSTTTRTTSTESKPPIRARPTFSQSRYVQKHPLFIPTITVSFIVLIACFALIIIFAFFVPDRRLTWLILILAAAVDLLVLLLLTCYYLSIRATVVKHEGRLGTFLTVTGSFINAPWHAHFF